MAMDVLKKTFVVHIKLKLHAISVALMEFAILMERNAGYAFAKMLPLKQLELHQNSHRLLEVCCENKVHQQWD